MTVIVRSAPEIIEAIKSPVDRLEFYEHLEDLQLKFPDVGFRIIPFRFSRQCI